MLAGLGRGGDANHLARASLQDQEIANANVVAWDGNGAGRHWFGVVGSGAAAGYVFNWARGGDLDFLVLDDYFLTVVVVVMVVVMTERWSVDGVSDAFSNTLDSSAKGMIMSVVVVVAHITLARCVNSGPRGFLYGVFCLGDFVLIVVPCCGAETILSVLGFDGPGTFTVLAFGGVESGLECRCWASNDASFAVVGCFFCVGPVLDVELNVGVSRVGLVITSDERTSQ